MESVTLHLFKGSNAEDSFAISLHPDASHAWKAERGYGHDFTKVWTVELQSSSIPPGNEIDWEAVLDRVAEAYTLSDPVISNFDWPRLKAA